MSNSNKSLDELLKDYQKNKGMDFLDTSLKASLSFIPGLSQFFNDYVKSPSTKRLEKFLAAVVQEIKNLQNNNDEKINLENKNLVNFDDVRNKKSPFGLSHEVNQIRFKQPNQLNSQELVNLTKNIIEVEKKIANFLDQPKFTTTSYVSILNGSIYCLGYKNIFIQPDIVSANINKTVTALGQSFINFIQSPLQSDT